MTGWGAGPNGILLKRVGSIEDLMKLAARRVPRGVFDYVHRGAVTGTSLKRSREAFKNVELLPRGSRDVTHVDTSTSFFGRSASFPFGIAPTGFLRMMHPDGELAVIKAAAAIGIPCVVSMMTTTSPEVLAAAAPNADKWFQLYLQRDPEANEAVLARVWKAGFRGLILTVDVPGVAGKRREDAHHQFIIPPRLPNALPKKPGKAVRLAEYWAAYEGQPPVEPALFPGRRGTIGQLMGTFTSVTLDDVAWLREHWGGPLVVKGITSVDHAKQVVDRGADGIVVSNHGGRQLDLAVAPLELLPGIVKGLSESGRGAAVWYDGGVLRAQDAVVVAACRAKALFGRAHLYGLMAAGEEGVQFVLNMFAEGFRSDMRMLGVNRIAELGPDRVNIPGVSHQTLARSLILR